MLKKRGHPDYSKLSIVGNCCIVNRRHNVEITMETKNHHIADSPCNDVSVNDDKSSADAAGTFNSECCAANTSELETNGKCPEQLEMMSLKDGVPHVRDAKDFAAVLSLGCDCRQRSTLRGVVVMVIMLLSNMLNYMDRFTIVGMLKFVLLIM